MDFIRAKKEAFVDDKPTDISPNTTAREVLRDQGHDPSNKNLVQISPSGKPVVLNPNERINLNEGNQFEAIIAPTAG